MPDFEVHSPQSGDQGAIFSQRLARQPAYRAIGLAGHRHIRPPSPQVVRPGIMRFGVKPRCDFSLKRCVVAFKAPGGRKRAKTKLVRIELDNTGDRIYALVQRAPDICNPGGRNGAVSVRAAKDAALLARYIGPPVHSGAASAASVGKTCGKMKFAHVQSKWQHRCAR